MKELSFKRKCGETKELTSFEQFNLKTQVLWFKEIDRPEQTVCFKLPFFDIISSNLLNSVWNDQFVSKLAFLNTKFVTFTEISMEKVWKLKEKQSSCFFLTFWEKTYTFNIFKEIWSEWKNTTFEISTNIFSCRQIVKRAPKRFFSETGYWCSLFEAGFGILKRNGEMGTRFGTENMHDMWDAKNNHRDRDDGIEEP